MPNDPAKPQYGRNGRSRDRFSALLSKGMKLGHVMNSAKNRSRKRPFLPCSPLVCNLLWPIGSNPETGTTQQDRSIHLPDHAPQIIRDSMLFQCWHIHENSWNAKSPSENGQNRFYYVEQVYRNPEKHQNHVETRNSKVSASERLCGMIIFIQHWRFATLCVQEIPLPE